MLKYSMNVGEGCLAANGDQEAHFWIELGAKLKANSIPVQKRWVRARVEQEWGAPIKNPTQKRKWFTTYFGLTEETAPGCWHVVIVSPKIG